VNRDNAFTSLDHLAGLTAFQLVKTPGHVRRTSRVVALILLLLPVLLLLVPWTQTVHGIGSALAFNPVQRPQYVVSPIEGRIKKWYVVEGDRVVAGQRLVELVDNDPHLIERLLEEERAITARLAAAEQRVRDIESRIRNLKNSRDLAIIIQNSLLQQEQNRLRSLQFEQIGLEADLLSMQQNYDRVKKLVESKVGGLASIRDLEVAEQNLNTAKAKVEAGRARIALAQEAVKAAEKSLEKVDADTAAMVNLERAGKQLALAEIENIRREKLNIEVRIARQRAQFVESPVDGTVFRLLAAGESGGILVRPGERLAILVPDIKAGEDLIDQDHPGIVAELRISGNDLPLVRKGDPVRLQFEGWPAVQFVGWPSVAVGTFGGRVYLIDPTADETGKFRILVEPDPEDQPWPDERYLRQGVRAQGWVLLNQVTLGWELWRQLNGFPPFREPAPDTGQPLGPVKPKRGK
jgi:multidrug efflux pump subunit AcrA (membrane-fusion protein)